MVMKMQYINGDIGLKPFTLVDLEYSNYRNWFDDCEVTKYTSHGIFPLTDVDTDNFFNIIDRKEKIVWAIYHLDNEKKNSTHIGNVSLQKIDLINSSAEAAIIIGEKDFWNKGIGLIAFSIAVKHGFEKLNLNRIYAGTNANNIGMCRIFKKVNMKQEGTLKEAIRKEGVRYDNIVIYSILACEFFIQMERINK